MTNDELNRAVATLRGLTQCQCDPHCGFWYPTADGEPQLLPDYCTDPAAWGQLFVALAAEGLYPSIQAEFADRYIATVGRANATDPLPGRALCLAFVASREGT